MRAAPCGPILLNQRCMTVKEVLCRNMDATTFVLSSSIHVASNIRVFKLWLEPSPLIMRGLRNNLSPSVSKISPSTLEMLKRVRVEFLRRPDTKLSIAARSSGSVHCKQFPRETDCKLGLYMITRNMSITSGLKRVTSVLSGSRKKPV